MYKLGQRIKVVKSTQRLEGQEGYIYAVPGVFCECSVMLDKVRSDSAFSKEGEFDADFEQLRPLTDPGVEAIKEMAKRPVKELEPA